jgi:drug/metabolite transporter (DMT)-like permease
MDKRSFGKTGIRVPKSALQMTLGGIFLAAAVAVLIYYIQGPSLGVIHSDCTDSLLWSQVMLDSGHILSEDFRYAAILPFGSSLWTVPILAICGYSVTAYILSMSVFAVLFGWLFLQETLSQWETIGCIFVFAAVILSQLPTRKK